MKVLWLVNIVLPEAGKELNIPYSVFGGWLTGALNGIRDKVDVTVASVSGDVTEKVGCEVNSVRYFVFPRKNRAATETMFRDYLAENSFDIVHIYGTEMEHSAAMMSVAPPEKTVINIQGLTGTCWKHYCEGIPDRIVKDNLFKKGMRFLLRGRILEVPPSCEKRAMAGSGRREISTVEKCQNMIGRTSWDRACVMQINPNLHYYHVNETLRDSFYSEKHWRPDDCERHSIFLSQASYPIKGLHYFLEALIIIKKTYPDVHVYISGFCGIAAQKALRRLRDRYFGGYFGYVNTMIADYGLFENITLLGLLDEAKMAEQYLKSHVFVCPSTIENSPNSVGEAMMLGTPVVASYVGGIPDMLVNGKEGLLYQTSAPYMLADCVMRIFADDDLAMELSGNAITRAHVTHDKKRNADALLAVYEDIANAND